jgi:hypothetical protein
VAAVLVLVVIWSHELFFRDPARIRQLLALGGL